MEEYAVSIGYWPIERRKYTFNMDDWPIELKEYTVSMDDWPIDLSDLENITYPRVYHAYLGSKRWRTKAKARLKQDHYTCQICGEKAREVHHLSYDRVFFERLEDLQSLCKPCHRLIHNKEQKGV